MQIEVC